MQVLNVGSINIDHVYRVNRIVKPGETIASRSYKLFAGGKGANQSVALARAGARVFHLGQVGPDADWVLEKLANAGVDISLVARAQNPTGHAIIQVEDSGQNSIVLFGGANHALHLPDVEAAIAKAPPGAFLLLQNEVNDIDRMIRAGQKRGLRVCLNPAPFSDQTRDLPIRLVHTLIVNQSEARGLVGDGSPTVIMAKLAEAYPDARIILTLGAQGVLCRSGSDRVELPAIQTRVVDTTAAGDTFIGYFLAGQAKGMSLRQSLAMATIAASVCVSRAGAMDSIPSLADLA